MLCPLPFEIETATTALVLSLDAKDAVYLSVTNCAVQLNGVAWVTAAAFVYRSEDRLSFTAAKPTCATGCVSVSYTHLIIEIR